MKHWRAYIRKRIKIDPKTGCWLWQLRCDKDGYGHTTHAYVHGLDSQAHRLSFTAFKGRIPKGKVVRHKCHTPPCCNPEHLLKGTPQDNTNDSRRDGRKVGKPKLTHAQVVRIKKRLAKGALQREVAVQFGVHPSAISNIKRGRRWTHT
jgi:hypothetical protein